MNFFMKMIYPNKCPFCGVTIPYSRFSCETCSCLFKSPGLKITFHVNANDFINVSPFAYEGKIKNAIWRFKFRNHKENAFPFAFVINIALQNIVPDLDVDFITSVPISKARIKVRGYNQTELFARELARLRKIKYKNLLTKTKNNLEQHTLSLKDRAKNVRGVYSTKQSGIIKDKKILLCDDIITTGNTMGECRKVLMDSGAKKVFCTTIAVVNCNIRG